MKTETVANRITVLNTAGSNAIFNYFNPHCPSPIYSSQPGQGFKKYLTNCAVRAISVATTIESENSGIAYTVGKEKRNDCNWMKVEPNQTKLIV